MSKARAMTTAVTIASTLWLAACVSPPAVSGPDYDPQTRLGDGSVAYRIDCDSSARGMNFCLEKAGKSCGADGYTIVTRNGIALSSSTVAEGDLQTLTRAYENDSNSIFIRCGA